MRRLAVIAVLLFVVAATPFGAVTAAATVPTDGATGPVAVTGQVAPETPASASNTTEAAGNESDAEESDGGASDAAATGRSPGLAPGAQLAGVIAVQQADIDGELEQRSFEMQVTTSKSEESKADVVSRQLNQTDRQLADLRERLNELEKAHREGNISEGRYQAQAARLSAEIQSARRMINETDRTVANLSAETRQSNNITEERMSRLRNDAENLSKSSVADAARNLSGAGAGDGLAPDGASVVNNSTLADDGTCSVPAAGGNRSINGSSARGNTTLTGPASAANGSAGVGNASAGLGDRACGNSTRVGNATDAPGAADRSNATGNATGTSGLAGRNNATAGNATETPLAGADSPGNSSDSGRRDAPGRSDDAAADGNGSAPANSGTASGRSHGVGADRPATADADPGRTGAGTVTPETTDSSNVTDARTDTATAVDSETPTDTATETESGLPASDGESASSGRTATETVTATATDTGESVETTTETETETETASEAPGDAPNAPETPSEGVGASDEGAAETTTESEIETETAPAADDAENASTGAAEDGTVPPAPIAVLNAL